MTHDQIVAEIQIRATQRGVLSHYCKRSVTCDGDRGLPDLLLVGNAGVAWIEVKTPSSPDLKRDQIRWKYALKAAGQIYEIMNQRDLIPGGAVDMILNFITAGP